VAVDITVYVTAQGSYINLTVVFHDFSGQNYFIFQTFQGIFIHVYINNIIKKLA